MGLDGWMDGWMDWLLPLTARSAGAEVKASSASNDEAVTCRR